jgi:hypothetical protein
MAYLNTATLRPACVISNVSREMIKTLKRELNEVVAISSCPILELESTVNRQGAQIAIVGSREKGIEIAERLSHAAPAIRVYLVDENKTALDATPLNGFAGVFCAQTEAHRISAEIRQHLPHKQPPESAKRTPSSSTKSAFTLLVGLQKRLAQPTVLHEMILDAFLETSGAEEGLLLLPTEASGNFSIAAARSETFQEQGSLELTSSWRDELENGRTITNADGRPKYGSTGFAEDFSLAVPVLSRGELIAVLLADSPHLDGDVFAFVEGVALLLEQGRQRQKRQAWEENIGRIRASIMPGWMLLDDRGRMVHSEGEWPSALRPARRGFTQPRLRDAIARAAKGEEVSVSIQSHKLEFHAEKIEGIPYVVGTRVLEQENSVSQVNVPSLKDFFSLAREKFKVEAVELESVQKISNLAESVALDPAKWSTELSRLNLELSSPTEQLPTKVLRPLFVIGAALRWMGHKALKCQHTSVGDAEFLNFEIPEAELPDQPGNFTNHPLLRLGMGACGINGADAEVSPFGFRIVIPSA